MSTLNDYDRFDLGASKGLIQLERTAAIRDVTASLARQARRELLIFGRTLEPELYDQQPFLEGVRHLALSRSSLCVRVLVFDARDAATSSGRLIELARRLTSRIEIRCVAKDDQARLDAFLIADERGYLHRQLADAMEAVADFDNPLDARRLRTDFNQIWEQGTADSELRRLHI